MSQSVVGFCSLRSRERWEVEAMSLAVSLSALVE